LQILNSNFKQQIRLRDPAARNAPSFAGRLRRKKSEGAGKTGCALHPRSRVQNAHKENAHEHTGSAEAIRPSLRNGFTAYAVLSPATNSFLSPSSADMVLSDPVGLTLPPQI
jgi:hypothetical protein